jgi:predicted peroxiredoxin
MEFEVMIYFTMFGPTLLRRDVIDKIGPKGDRGQPLRHFIEQATGLGVRLLVCQPSLDLNDLSLDDLIDGVEVIGAATFNDLAAAADAVVSF